MKKVTCSSARHFVCRRCTDVGDGTEEPVEVLSDQVETVKGFCYLGDRLNASGGCETAVTSRVGIGWMKFRKCEELLRGRRFSLRMKEMVYRSCVRSAMLYGSETWCLRETEMAILRRTERAMVRSMCGVKLVDRKKMEDLMEMLGLKETLNKIAKANGVRWYGHVLRREDDNILKRAMMMEVTWRRQVEKSVKKVGLKIKLEMEGRCESDRGEDEVYPAIFGNEEKTELKLDRRRTVFGTFLWTCLLAQLSSTSLLVNEV